MTSAASLSRSSTLGAGPEDSARSEFLRWQCLIRQYSARFDDARPSPGMAPELFLDGAVTATSRMLVLLNRDPGHTTVPEFRHIHRRTQDPRERREALVSLLASTHYQRPERFSDRLSAIFPPGAPVAGAAIRSRRCTLRFVEHGRRFWLACRTALAPDGDPLRDESFWFGRLFNPNLPASCQIVAFEPDWSESRAE